MLVIKTYFHIYLYNRYQFIVWFYMYLDLCNTLMDEKYCAYSLGVRFVARLLPSRNIFIVKRDCIMKKCGEIDIYFPFDQRSGNTLYVFHKSGWKIRQNLLFMRESLCCDKSKDRILMLAVDDISFKLFIFIRYKIITSA